MSRKRIKLAGFAEYEDKIMLASEQYWRIARAMHYDTAKNAEKLIKRASKFTINRVQGEEKEALLHICAKKGFTKFAGILLDKGAELEIKDGDKRTPLVWAVIHGKCETAKLLIERGANVNEISESGTPLIFLAQKGCTDMVKLLVNNGADMNVKVGHCPNLLIYSIIGNGQDLCSLVNFLLDKGVNIDEQGSDSESTALYWSALYQQLDVVKTLVWRGANTNLTNYRYQTPEQHIADFIDKTIPNYLKSACNLKAVICLGMFSENKGEFQNYLTKGLYDPRLFILISSFAF